MTPASRTEVAPMATPRKRSCTRRNVLTVTAASASAALWLAACGGANAPASASKPAAAAPTPAGPATVTWLAWAAAGPEADQYQLSIDAFAKQQPQIHVDFVN